MKFKMTAARLLASSYGSSFSPSDSTLPHVFASAFSSGGSSTYQQLLTSAMLDWSSEKEFSDGIAAMNYARISLAKFLSDFLSAAISLTNSQSTYVPVEEPGGGLVGIDGVVWMQRDSSQVQTTISNPSLTLMACVFISLQRIS